MKKVVIKKVIFVWSIFLFLIFIGEVFALGNKVLVDIDKKAPNLVDFDYSINHRKVNFSFVIEEDNFKQIYYRDVAECSRRFIKYNVLCKRLFSDGSCFSVRDLCAGKHKMQITIVDKAGNSFTTPPFEFVISL